MPWKKIFNLIMAYICISMKILWLAHRDPLNPRAGGAERTIYEVVIRLAKTGHKIVQVTGGWNGCKSIENIKGLEIHRFGKNIGLHFAAPFFLLKYNFDLAVHDLGHAVPSISSAILNKYNIVFFRHLHVKSLPGQVNPIIAKLITAIERCYSILYRHTVFVTESTTSKNDLIGIGIKDDEIIMNPPGVDLSLFHPAPKSKYSSMVYFGGMRIYKRHLEVLYVLKSLLEKLECIKLFIIDAGPEEQAMKRLAKELNVQNYVEFTGRISSEELSDIVALSWLNVHTSVTEGWGYSIIKASAAVTPTIAYDVPGVRDAVEDGLNSIRVKDGDRKALEEAAFTILTKPEKWWSSSIKVAEKYSWDKTSELWIKLLQEENKK